MKDRFPGRALSVHFRVVSALVLRETRTRFGRSQLGYLWALIEPTLFVVTFVLIYRVASRHNINGVPADAFFTCGIMLWLLFFNTQSKMMVAFSSNKNLLAYPQVTTFDILVARLILEGGTSAAILAVLTFTLMLLGTPIELGNLMLMVYAFVLALLLGAGVGMVLCGVRYYFDVVDKIAPPLLRFVYFGSGAFYSIMIVPTSVRDILLLNPMTHVLEIARLGFFREYRDPMVSLTYPLYFSLIAFFFGLISDRLTRSKIAA